jgi:hypothetical protein
MTLSGTAVTVAGLLWRMRSQLQGHTCATKDGDLHLVGEQLQWCVLPMTQHCRSACLRTSRHWSWHLFANACHQTCLNGSAPLLSNTSETVRMSAVNCSMMLQAGMDRGRVFSNKSDIMRMVVSTLEEQRVDYSLPASKGGQVATCLGSMQAPSTSTGFYPCVPAS